MILTFIALVFFYYMIAWAYMEHKKGENKKW